MSKKATRRAARDAFPKAKNPPPKRDAYSTRTRPKSANRGRASVRPQARPASLKRAAIWGVVMAILYFAMVEWAWKSGASTLGNIIISIGTFVVFSAVIYATDHFKYQRYLRKKGQVK